MELTYEQLKEISLSFKDKHGEVPPDFKTEENKYLPDNCYGIKTADGRWGFINIQTMTLVLIPEYRVKVDRGTFQRLAPEPFGI